MTTKLVGAVPSEEVFADAARTATAGLRPATDIHGSAAYRAQLARTLTRRAVLAAQADASQRARTLTAS